MRSVDLFQRSQKVSPGGVHSPVRAFKSVGGQPIFFQSAEGAHIKSVEGTRYVDFCQSFGPNILGHRDAEVAEVVHRAVDTAWSLGACEPYSLELAEWIRSRVPQVQKLRFVCSGTEAVMSALRVARAASGRKRVLKFAGCYHGHVDALLVKAGSGLAGVAASDSAGIDESIIHNTLIVPLDSEVDVNTVFESYGSEIGVVIIEPMPANYGLLLQRPEYLRHLVSVAKKHGAIVIFDEVISGFRVAMGGMVEVLGLDVDLVTYGKIMGGGFPVGAYGGRADLMDWVAPSGPVYQAGTLAANPIGMQAGLATLQKMARESVHGVLERRTSQFAERLRSEFDRRGIPLGVTHFASIFWIHSKVDRAMRSLKDIPVSLSEKFAPFFHACLKRGVYLAPSAFEVNFVSLAHSNSILDEAASNILAAAQEVYAQG